MDQATEACALLPEREAGSAWYQLGEVYRLRGQYDRAEVAFRHANAAGRQPEPGLARLRLAQGRPQAAIVALRRTCAEARSPEDRAELLRALAEALVAVRDPRGARAAAEELAEIAGQLDARVLSAWAAEALGSVTLAEEQPAAALPILRRAAQLWHEVDLPHHAAKVRVAIARCLRDLGDEDSARMELEAARDVFQRLGAEPDVAAVDALRPAGDGQVLDVANVLWCTGFRQEFGFIHPSVVDETGWPVEDRGVVPSAPGLYFMGLLFQSGFYSMLIGGTGRDAAEIAGHIARRQRVRGTLAPA